MNRISTWIVTHIGKIVPIMAVTLLFSGLLIQNTLNSDASEAFLEFRESSLKMTVGESAHLPLDASFDWNELSWIASDPSAIRVEGDNVHAVAPGSYSLKVTGPANRIEAILHVHVEPSWIDVMLQGKTYRFASPIETNELTVNIPESMKLSGFYLDESLSIPWEETLITSSVQLFPKFTAVKEATPTYTVTLIRESSEQETFQIAPETTVEVFLDAIELDTFLLEADGMTCLHVIEPTTLITEDTTFRVGDPNSHPCTIRESDFEIQGELIVGNALSVETLDASLNFEAQFTAGSLNDAGTTLLLDETMVGQDVQLIIEAQAPYDGTVTIDLGPVKPAPNLDESETVPEPLYTITIVNETGTALASKAFPKETLIEDNMTWAAANYVGYVQAGNTCETLVKTLPAVTASITWVAVTDDHRTPCIALDSMIISGDVKVGETLDVHVLPNDATVTYQWFISEDNRYFKPLLNETGASINLIPEYHRQYLAVNVSGEGDYTGLLKAGTARIELNSQFVAKQIIIDGERYIPLASRADLEAINSETSHVFARGTAYEMTTKGGLGKSYILIDDIDLSGDAWIPLDTFNGVLEGDNKSIIGLNITEASTSRTYGLFESIMDATLSNLTFQSPSIVLPDNTNKKVGVLTGILEGTNSTIENILITNANIVARGNFRVGGLIGSMETTKLYLENIIVSGLIEAEGSVGGLIGFQDSNSELYVQKSANHATIVGNLDSYGHSGGLIGYILDQSLTQISSSYNTGNISSPGFGNGGLVGRVGKARSTSSDDKIDIYNSYNIGQVKGKNSVGGLIGRFDVDSNITDSYSAGEIVIVPGASNPKIGGLVGNDLSNSVVINDSFYLTSTALSAVGSSSDTVSPYAFEVNDFIKLNQFINDWDIAEKGSDAANAATWIIEDRLTFPYLSWTEHPLDIQRVSHYYIPIATREDLEAIESTNSHIFAVGTEFELVTSGGLGKSYILIDDIDLSEADWVPLASGSNPFNGVLFGNDKTISEMKVIDYRGGLFTAISGAHISSVIIDNAELSNTNQIGKGFIAESATNGSRVTLLKNLIITNSSIITVDSYSSGNGGLIAYNNSELIIENVHVSADIKGGTQSGGFIGLNINQNKIRIIQSSFNGNITVYSTVDSNYVAGFIGDNIALDGQIGKIEISDSYVIISLKSIQSDVYFGNFVGRVEDAQKIDISNSYALFTINEEYRGELGGVVGFMKEENNPILNVSFSFISGEFDKVTNSGGVIGDFERSDSTDSNDPDINLNEMYTNAIQISQTTDSSEIQITGVMGNLSTADFSGWDTTTWTTDQTLPYLSWEVTP